MSRLILLCAILLTQAAFARPMTKAEGRRVMNGEDYMTIVQERKQEATKSLRAKEGDKCKSNYDCQSKQYCRKVNYKREGVCVEKNTLE